MIELRKLAIAMTTLALVTGCDRPPTPAEPAAAPAPAPDTAANTAANAAANMAADEAAIAAVNPEWFRAFNEGDADRIAALYAEDAVYSAPGLPSLRGREAIRAYLVKDIANSAAAGLTFVPPATTEHGLSGDLGWEWGTFALTDKSGATVETGKYVTVYQRTAGKWLIIRDIFNTDTPPPAAAPASPAAPDAASAASGAPPVQSPTGESPTG